MSPLRVRSQAVLSTRAWVDAEHCFAVLDACDAPAVYERMLAATDVEVTSAIKYLNALPGTLPSGRGMVASIAQGRALLDAARLFGVEVNSGFEKLVARHDDAGVVVPFGAGLTLTVIGPARKELGLYQKKWNADLTDGKKEGRVASARLDKNAFNLASIAVLAEVGGRTMLLTGDAGGAPLLEGLEAAGRLSADGRMKVDVMKLPHHGSSANVTLELLSRVTAETYVVSANGKHDNPDRETLNRLTEARGSEPYTLACTFRERAHDFVEGDSKEANERRLALRNVDAWASSNPNVTMVYRAPGENGVRVELGDETLD